MTKTVVKIVCIILMVLYASNVEAQKWVKWYRSYSGWSIGINEPIDWKAGARWTPEDLQEKGVRSGDIITKVRFIVSQISFISYCNIEIYQGGSWPSNQGSLVQSEWILTNSLVDGDYTEVTLTSPLTINTAKELWIVYRIKASGGYPLGRDSGPIVNKKGNIMYVDGTWTTFEDFSSRDENWIIEFYTENTPPTITSGSLPNGSLGVAYNRTLTANGTIPITWTKESGSLPNGLSLSGNGTISGTPTAEGTFNFTVKATNNQGSDTKAISITIQSVPFILTNELPEGIKGTSYRQTLVAEGGTPITWSKESGNLPNGLTLSGGGTILGTPNTTGTFDFTVKAKNSVGSDTKALSITILAPPIITTMNNLPKGSIGIEYNKTLVANGTLPITWSIANGSLPDGLTLSQDGLISGIPSTAGTFNFTVKAANAAGSNTKIFSIVIEDEIGISENELGAISIYPNPTNTILFIDYKYHVQVTVKLFDLYGKEILTENFHGKIEININHLPKGIYSVNLFSEGKIIGKSKILKY